MPPGIPKGRGAAPLPSGYWCFGGGTMPLFFLMNKAFLIAWEGLTAHGIVWGGYAGALN